MNLILRILFIITLCICYKYLPVLEPKGINYLLSLLCLGFIGFELKKLWNSFNISENKKSKLQKIAYFSLIILILIIVTLTVHKEYPAGNIRFVRGFIILLTIVIAGKIVGMIVKSSINTFIKNTTLITFSTISFLAVLEIIFMFIPLSHGSGEAFSGKIWGNRYWNPINKLGFRDDEPKNGKRNVFFVGDSFTAGWGVKKIKDRFGEVAAEELKKQGKPINEINLGRYGADTRLEYYVLNKFIKQSKITPNEIVLQYFVNDMDNLLMPLPDNCTHSNMQISSWKKTLIEGSYLANYINGIYPSVNTTNLLPSECDYFERLKQAYNTDSIWKKEEILLNKFTSYCNQNNIKLTILFFPFMEDLSLAKKANIENRLKKYCLCNQINFINVTSYINHLSREKRQVSIVDAHASEDVHKIVGKILAQKIKL